MKKVPQWGKVIAILMIVFGSLGVFYQGYKIMIPSVIKMQNEIMNNFGDHSYNNYNDRVGQEVFRSVNEMMHISDLQHDLLIGSGIFGVLLCVFYIVAGAKMLKIGPQNLKLGKAALITFLTFNAIFCALLLSDETNVFVIGISFYSFMGIAIDTTLLIITMASNKDGYEIGGNEELDAITLNTNSDEIL